MSVDDLFDNVEKQLEVEADLLYLAQTWERKTNGVIREGVVQSEDEYIELLLNIPLWDEVRDQLPEYTRILEDALIRRENPLGAKARMLIFFPTVIYTLNHIFDNQRYSEGLPHNPLSSPFSFRSIMRHYQADGDGFMIRERGDCRSVLFALDDKYIDEDFVLRSTSLEDKWKIYLQNKRIPSCVARKIAETVTHFLQHKQYSDGRRSGPVGSPLPLGSFLRNYKARGKGEITDSKGDCRQFYFALFNDTITREMIWEVTGMQSEWELYEQSRQLPTNVRDELQKTLQHFLAHPHYSTGNAGHGPRGSPIAMEYVLRSYVPSGEGVFRQGNGPCRKIWEALYREKGLPQR